MEIGLIDVDGHNFPNIPLMKISAYHKSHGDTVEFVIPIEQKQYDKVYMSKVFSFTEDYPYFVNADEIHRGGTGYAIELVDGKEVYHKEKDTELPAEIEKMFPDYSLYGITDTAYGKLTSGCPRGCDFCIVGKKEGRCSHKVAELSDFWDNQKNIVLLDPNMFACKDWRELSEQLIASRAWIDFCQGVDIRIMTEEMAGYIKRMKIKMIHFAWDRYSDKEKVLPKLKTFHDITGWDHRKMMVYVLTNFDSTWEHDIERIMTLRAMDYDPYVMIYNKESLKPGHRLKKLQRWVNNKFVFWSCPTFEDYLKVQGSDAQWRFLKQPPL